jgi:DNA repair protein RecN (Recombination protein N)
MMTADWSSRTLVFDEVDAGIGGRVAELVGRKLKQVSKRNQVICVTHLPQIAAFADRHLHIYKESRGGRTRTHLEVLDGERRIEEIARMLGGSKLTETATKHAREMLQDHL